MTVGSVTGSRYREMAEDVIDRVVKLKGFVAGSCTTMEKPLWGGEGYTDNTNIKLVQK
jgi:glycerol-3-phosphate dehydrogenase